MVKSGPSGSAALQQAGSGSSRLRPDNKGLVPGEESAPNVLTIVSIFFIELKNDFLTVITGELRNIGLYFSVKGNYSLFLRSI